MFEVALALLLGVASLPWLWLGAVILLCCADVALTEAEAFGWGILMLGSGVVGVAWIGADVNLFTWAWAHLAEVLLLGLLYLCVGGLWSIVKWWRYLVKVRDEIVKIRVKYAESPIGQVDAELEKDKRPRRPSTETAYYNKHRIVGWIAHWPFSVVGSLIGDVLLQIFRRVFDLLRGVYDRIYGHVFADFE